LPPRGNHADRGRLSLVACESGRAFAARVDRHLVEIVRREDGDVATTLRRSEEVRFANGEVKTVVGESVRGDDVYVVQCVADPLGDRSVNDNFLSLLTAVNAVYQSDPDSITAVIPQFPYSRQDRRTAREAITARLIAAALEDAGANRVISLDVHSEAIEGFFQRAILEDLHAAKVIIPFVRDNVPMEDMCVVAPDTGGAHIARHYSKELGCALAVVDKARDYTRASVIESMRLVGDVAGRPVLIVDDMIATGETLLNASHLLRDNGAAAVYVACSLPFLNADATARLDEAHRQGLIRMVVGTDAVWRGEQFGRDHPWYREVPVAGLFARVIFNVNRRRSVSELLG